MGKKIKVNGGYQKHYNRIEKCHLLISRLDPAKRRISELEYMPIKTSQNEMKEVKMNIKKNTRTLETFLKELNYQKRTKRKK